MLCPGPLPVEGTEWDCQEPCAGDPGGCEAPWGWSVPARSSGFTFPSWDSVPCHQVPTVSFAFRAHTLHPVIQVRNGQLVLQVPESEHYRSVGVAGSGGRGSAPAPSLVWGHMLSTGQTSSSIWALEHWSFRSTEDRVLVSVFYSFCSIKRRDNRPTMAWLCRARAALPGGLAQWAGIARSPA